MKFLYSMYISLTLLTGMSAFSAGPWTSGGGSDEARTFVQVASYLTDILVQTTEGKVYAKQLRETINGRLEIFVVDSLKKKCDGNAGPNDFAYSCLGEINLLSYYWGARTGRLQSKGIALQYWVNILHEVFRASDPNSENFQTNDLGFGVTIGVLSAIPEMQMINFPEGIVAGYYVDTLDKYCSIKIQLNLYDNSLLITKIHNPDTTYYCDDAGGVSEWPCTRDRCLENNHSLCEIGNCLKALPNKSVLVGLHLASPVFTSRTVGPDWRKLSLFSAPVASPIFFEASKYDNAVLCNHSGHSTLARKCANEMQAKCQQFHKTCKIVKMTCALDPNGYRRHSALVEAVLSANE